MVTGRPFFVSDVRASMDSDEKLRMLSPSEREGFAESGARSLLLLPYQYNDKDYVLTLCFSATVDLTDILVDSLWQFCHHLVRAFEKAQIEWRGRALLKLSELLSPPARVERSTMDAAAEVIRQTIHAGGVSIFLLSRDGKHLQRDPSVELEENAKAQFE